MLFLFAYSARKECTLALVDFYYEFNKALRRGVVFR